MDPFWPLVILALLGVIYFFYRRHDPYGRALRKKLYDIDHDRLPIRTTRPSEDEGDIHRYYPLSQQAPAGLSFQTQKTEVSIPTELRRELWGYYSSLEDLKKYQSSEAGDFDFLHLVPIMTSGFITIPEAKRFEHHWIVATSGHGKTQCLQTMIASDLNSVAENTASIVVIDSENKLIPLIAHLKQFAPGQSLSGKLIRNSMRAQYSIVDAEPARSQVNPPQSEPKADTADDTLHWNITISPKKALKGGTHTLQILADPSGQKKSINITIPAGTIDGARFRLKGAGIFRRDGTRGDIVLTVRVPTTAQHSQVSLYGSTDDPDEIG